MWCAMLERKGKAFVHMYLPTISPQWGWFSIWVTGFLVLSSIEMLHLAENCYLLLRTLLKFGNAMGELDTKKFNPTENPAVVYKWRNIKGQVAHCSQGMWGLEGNNGLGATSWTTLISSVYPTMTAVNSVYACHLTETNGLFLYMYRATLPFGQNMFLLWSSHDGDLFLSH